MDVATACASSTNFEGSAVEQHARINSGNVRGMASAAIVAVAAVFVADAAADVAVAVGAVAVAVVVVVAAAAAAAVAASAAVELWRQQASLIEPTACQWT